VHRNRFNKARQVKFHDGPEHLPGYHGRPVLEAQIVNVFIDANRGKAVVPDRGLASKWHDLAMAGEKEEANG
jgi:hypothetical protein